MEEPCVKGEGGRRKCGDRNTELTALVTSWGCLVRGIERALQTVRVLFISIIYDVVVGTRKFTLLLIFNCTRMRIFQHKIENIISKTVNWHSHCASFVIILGPAVLVQGGASSAGEILNT